MRKTVVLLLTLLMLSVMGSIACGAAATALENKKWILESYGEQGNLQAVLEGSEITAIFSSTKSEVSGCAGCNSYFAGYQVHGNELTILQIAQTEMACVTPKGVMEQEQEFLSILSNAATFEVEDNQLTIFCPGSRVLVFNKSD